MIATERISADGCRGHDEAVVRRLRIADFSSRRLGVSPSMERLASDALRVAASSFRVLILGETGVGKTHLASFLHDLSPRREGPFLSLNAGALPETLLEGELFGWDRGAFTGADRRRPGLLQTANGGTLFLADVDTVPLGIQAKLLGDVETGRFFPLGGRVPLQTDVRIVAASNRSLAWEAAEGRFRTDLLYRLQDVVLTVPPLRERPEDIAWLAERFVAEAAQDLGCPAASIDEDAMELLAASPWPGNIRELRSVLRRAILFGDGTVTAGLVRQVLGDAPGREAGPPGGANLPGSLLLSDLEAWGVRRALAESRGTRTRAADLLGVTCKTLRAMMDRHGIA